MYLPNFCRLLKLRPKLKQAGNILNFQKTLFLTSLAGFYSEGFDDIKKLSCIYVQGFWVPSGSSKFEAPVLQIAGFQNFQIPSFLGLELFPQFFKKLLVLYFLILTNTTHKRQVSNPKLTQKLTHGPNFFFTLKRSKFGILMKTGFVLAGIKRKTAITSKGH